MTTNDELFVQVLAQIEREPLRWDQQSFGRPCDTAFCFAGWACNLNGWQFVAYGRVRKVSGDGRLVSRQAERLLGIPSTWRDAEIDEHLFDSSNSLDDLYRISAAHMGIDETVLRDKVRDAIGRPVST